MSEALLPTNSKVKPLKMGTFDIETDFKDKVELIGFFNGEKYFEFTCIDTFLGEVLKKKYYGYNFYAHYGGKFDFNFILDDLLKYARDFNVIDVNGRILEIKIIFGGKYSGKHINFRDSYALMPSSLEKITKGFSAFITHVKIPHNFHDENDIYYSCLEHKKDNCIHCYLKSDTLGLYQSLRYFETIINNNFNSNIKLSIASTSKAVFLNNYLERGINSINYDVITGYDINKNPILLNVEDIVRLYYVGGRSEIFKRHCENEFYYDVNSLYPYVMYKYDYPVSRPNYILPEDLDFKNDKGFAYAEIFFYKDDIIPFLPFRINMDSSRRKLIYPVGTFEGLYDLDVLRKAKEIGYDINIKYALVFNYEAIFKNFVQDLYGYRLKNEALNIIMKFVLNSLYGKFAQKRDVTNIVRIVDNFEKINFEDLIPYNDNFGLYKLKSYSNASHIIPSLSSRTTQLASLELYEKIEKCKHNITYVDTDSITTPVKLKTGNGLGELKLEYEIEEGVYLLPKTYAFHGFDVKNEKPIEKIVMKGFIDPNFNFNDFKHSLITEDLSKFNYDINKIWGFKQSFNTNSKFLTFGKKVHSLKSAYDKRIIMADRINTKPLLINNHVILNKR